MTFYVRSALSPTGALLPSMSIEIVNGRMNATEFGKDDAKLLQSKAKKMRPDCAWLVDRAYSGKYVVRGQSGA